MDRSKSSLHPTADQILRQLRHWYQCFLLHLILGLSVTSLLLFSVIAFSAYLPNAVQDLNALVSHSLPHPKIDNKEKQTLSQAVFEQTVYVLPHTTDVPSPTTDNNRKRQNISSVQTIRGHLQTKDSAIPLGQPLINDTCSDGFQPAVEAEIPAGHTAILPTDLSQSAQFNAANGGILFSNQTDYSVNALHHLAESYPIPTPAHPTMLSAETISDRTAPLVLILHTHGTEAYAPDGAASVPSDYAYRSEDITQNVISVGTVLAQTLQNAGISVLHCQTMFDAASYTDSYVQAAAYIQKTVAAYPSIQYVFDVHRDALAASDGSMLRPITQIGAEPCAQIMSVVGTDGAGAYYPDWRDNLTVAVHLQKRLNDAYPAFARPINLRAATFNAQYAPGSLLLEIGAAGNSVEEARSAAFHLGKIMAEMILDS